MQNCRIEIWLFNQLNALPICRESKQSFRVTVGRCLITAVKHCIAWQDHYEIGIMILIKKNHGCMDNLLPLGNFFCVALFFIFCMSHSMCFMQLEESRLEQRTAIC
jgi:hypothetical protein